jgi:hypothetical protein
MKTPLDFSISKAAVLTGLSRRAINEIVAPLPDDAGVEQLIAAFVTAVRAEPAAAQPHEDPNEPKMPRGIYSLSALHQTFMLDRETIRARLRKEKIKPAFEKARFKGFRLTDKGKSGLTVKQILEADADPRLTDVKIRSLEASARVKELEFEEKSGNIRADILREVRDEGTRLIKALQTRLVKRYWRENAANLRRCKTAAELQRAGETDQSLIFDECKREYPSLTNPS